MYDIKFINLEQIYLNTFKSDAEEKEFWEKKQDLSHMFYDIKFFKYQKKLIFCEL